jgi:hypothetical protein
LTSSTGSISIFFLTLIGFLALTLDSFFDIDLPFDGRGIVF